MPERELAAELDDMTGSAIADPRIADADLVPVLRFIGQVVVLVGQAFDQVLASLIELSYLKPEDLHEPRRTELLAGIDNVLARSRYKDVEEICSRLHSLSELYERAVRPKLGGLADEGEWSAVFRLLDEYEGAIIGIVKGRVYGLRSQLADAGEADLVAIRSDSVVARDDVQRALERLWDLRNRILGLSGTAGLLELLATGRRSEAIAATAAAPGGV